MTVHVLAHATSGGANRATSIRRPALDLFVERVARGLLAWSDRRAAKLQLSHERMALLLANELSAPRGGSTFGR